MTERLTHTHDAYVRRMQMSATSVFVFVEGDSDQFFYGKLSERAYERHSYTLVPASILRGPMGKQGLIAFFRYLEDKEALVDDFKGKTTASVFCMDKDVDELTGDKIDSPHVVYTEAHSLENYFFIYGDLAEALSVVAEVQPAVARAPFETTSETEWRRNAAEAWRPWVELCLFARLSRLEGPSNYSAPSQVHNLKTLYAGADPVKCKEMKDRLREKAGLSEEDFGKKLDEIRAIVSGHFTEGQQDRVFKGEWYAYFAAQDASIWFAKSIDSKSLVKVLQTTLDWADSWANSTIEKLRSAAGLPVAG